jgi:AcrR family transcriptional regulator
MHNEQHATSTARSSSRATADVRRQELTRAAFELIAEHGLGGLRIRDVAARVGVNNATLHYYFPTKELLVQAVIESVGRAFVSNHAPDYDPAVDELTARSRLRRYFRDLLYQLETEPQRFLVVSELFVEEQRRRVMGQDQREDVEWQAYIVAILEDGIAAGEFRAGIDTIATARMIIAFCKGLPLLGVSSFADVEGVVAAFEQALLGAITPL